MARNTEAITSAAQVPTINSSGSWIMPPDTVVNGMYSHVSEVIRRMNNKPRSTVARNVKAEADMITGANIRTTNGFDSPPVKASRAASWQRSNSNVSMALRSDRRLLAGKVTVVMMLNATDAPIA